MKSRLEVSLNHTLSTVIVFFCDNVSATRIAKIILYVEKRIEIRLIFLEMFLSLNVNNTMNLLLN